MFIEIQAKVSYLKERLQIQRASPTMQYGHFYMEEKALPWT